MSEQVMRHILKKLRALCFVVSASLLYLLYAQTAFAAITIGNTSFGDSGGGALSFSHTVGAGSNRVLIVGISIDRTTMVNVISSVTYGGTTLTNIGNTAGSSNTMRISLWRLVNPAVGTANVVVTPSINNIKYVAGAVSYFGVDQTTPLGSFAAATGGSGTPTVNVSSAANDLVVDVVAVGDALLGNSIAPGAGQTQRYNINTATILGGGMIGAGSTEPGAATVTMSWTQNGSLNGRWAIGAVALKPAPPTITKVFNPNTIGVNNNSVLTFTITNPNPATSLTGAAFSDTYPVGLVNAASPSVTNTCGGTVTANAGAGSIALSAGTIATGTSTCTISVIVTSASAATYNNTSGAVASTNSGTGNTASAALVVLNRPVASKNFAPDPMVTGGASVLTVTLTNPNAGTAITGAAFTDTYPAQITNSATPSGSTTCGGSVTAASGGGSVSLSGGTIPAGGSCNVTVNVTSSTTGAHTNTIAAGALTSTNAGVSTAAASDTLTVTASLTVVKSTQTFSDPFNGATNPKAIPGAFIGYTIVVTNPGRAVDVDTVFVIDAIPANTDLFVGDFGGAGSGSVAFTDGAPASGLGYTFTSLASGADDVGFSNNGGATFTYTPAPDINGVDPAVTHVRINPKGVFNAGSNFTLMFRIRIE
ncbi:MAG: hypothetical protein M3Q32_02020 [Pseudomonadota bacterium]|nr:hypothetical protein [Pseudomonadota bacterium]